MSPKPKTANRELQELADRLYKGDLPKAFPHWILSSLTADIEPSEEELIEHTLDGAGDLGIDGYWLDDGNSKALLFQAKFTTRREFSLGSRAAKEIRSSAQSLLDQDYVAQHGNARVREVHADILEALLDDGYTLWLVLATNGRISRSAGTYAHGEGSAPWRFTYAGQEHTKDVVMDVVSLEEISKYRDRIMAASEPTPEINFEVPGKMYHKIPGDFSSIQVTVKASQIAEAYRKYRGGIFRLNIRGPLGSNRVNKYIVRSLQEPEYRKNFHILNNGLTVLCQGFRYDKAKSYLYVQDFQIVNGCQTTYTLHEQRDLLDDSVLLKMMVVEGTNWADIIARSTNMQSVVKAEDFRTLDIVQENLRKKFDSMVPPWLYEKKRGESRFRSAVERHHDKVRYGDRKLTMRETAQACLAFIGRPAMAKWDLRVFFDPQDEEGAMLYGSIFNDNIEPEQLLLSTLIHRRVIKSVNTILKQKASEVESLREVSITEVDWLPYARTHIVGLIGELLRMDNRDQADVTGLTSPRISRSLLATLDDWFDEHLATAIEAVRYRMDLEKKLSEELDRPLPNLREFFRKQREYEEMLKRVREL